MIIAFTGSGISKESGISTFQDKPEIRNYLVRTYASRHPEKYRAVMKDFVDMMRDKKPNDAHIALAEYDIPVITMNVDDLHEKAGTKHLVKIHGRLPKDEELPYCERLHQAPVLYGDEAPEYQTALSYIDMMSPGDILLVIGASDYTSISSQIRSYAKVKLAKIYEIQWDAGTRVRNFLEKNKDAIESWEDFKKRAPEGWFGE